MSIWIKLNKEYPISKLQSNNELKIINVDNKLNSFRFGFASMNEQELESAVNILVQLLNKD